GDTEETEKSFSRFRVFVPPWRRGSEKRSPLRKQRPLNKPYALLLTALLACATSVAAAARQAAPPPAPADAPRMSETFFQDIRVLQGIPIDELIDTMGKFAAATSKDGTGCHSPQILDGKPEAFAIETPMIQKARFMVGMMNTINSTFFGNQKRVSCFTCHANTSAPQNVPNMAIQYGD